MITDTARFVKGTENHLRAIRKNLDRTAELWYNLKMKIKFRLEESDVTV